MKQNEYYNAVVAGKVGSRLKESRRRKEFTREWVENETGVSVSQLWHYESGKYQPRLQNLIALADLYEVSLDWLCGR